MLTHYSYGFVLTPSSPVFEPIHVVRAGQGYTCGRGVAHTKRFLYKIPCFRQYTFVPSYPSVSPVPKVFWLRNRKFSTQLILILDSNQPEKPNFLVLEGTTGVLTSLLNLSYCLVWTCGFYIPIVSSLRLYYSEWNRTTTLVHSCQQAG